MNVADNIPRQLDAMRWPFYSIRADDCTEEYTVVIPEKVAREPGFETKLKGDGSGDAITDEEGMVPVSLPGGRDVSKDIIVGDIYPLKGTLRYLMG